MANCLYTLHRLFLMWNVLSLPLITLIILISSHLITPFINVSHYTGHLIITIHCCFCCISAGHWRVSAPTSWCPAHSGEHPGRGWPGQQSISSKQRLRPPPCGYFCPNVTLYLNPRRAPAWHRTRRAGEGCLNTSPLTRCLGQSDTQWAAFERA